MAVESFQKLQTLLENEFTHDACVPSLKEVVASVSSEISYNAFDDTMKNIFGVLLSLQKISSDKNHEKSMCRLFDAGISKMINIFRKFHEHFLSIDDPGAFNNIFLQVLETFTVLGESNKSKKSELIVSCCQPILKISLEEKASFLQRLEALKTLNLLLEHCPADLRNGLVRNEEFAFLLSGLTNNILGIGDYEYQVAAIEFLFRVIPKGSREKIVCSLFTEKKIAVDILRIRDTEFETDCRCVLNGINNVPSRLTGVTSIPCCAAVLGERMLMKPSDPGYHHFWVDFNEGSKRLLLFCAQDNQSQQSQTDDLWDTVSIKAEEVESYNIAGSGGKNYLKMFLRRPASEICPSLPTQEGNEFRITFSSRWTDLSSAVNKLFSKDYSFKTGNSFIGNLPPQRQRRSQAMKVSEAEIPVRLKSYQKNLHEEEVLSQKQYVEDSQFTVPESQQSYRTTQRRMSVPAIPMSTPTRMSLNDSSEPLHATAISLGSATTLQQTAELKDEVSAPVIADAVPTKTEIEGKTTPKTPVIAKVQKKIKTPVVTVTPPVKKASNTGKIRHSGEKEIKLSKNQKKSPINLMESPTKQAAISKKKLQNHSDDDATSEVEKTKSSYYVKQRQGRSSRSASVKATQVECKKEPSPKSHHIDFAKKNSKNIHETPREEKAKNLEKEPSSEQNESCEIPREEKATTSEKDKTTDQIKSCEKQSSVLDESGIEISSEPTTDLKESEKKISSSRKVQPPVNNSKQSSKVINCKNIKKESIVIEQKEDVEIIPDSFPAREKKHEKSEKDSGIGLGESLFFNESLLDGQEKPSEKSKHGEVKSKVHTDKTVTCDKGKSDNKEEESVARNEKDAETKEVKCIPTQKCIQEPKTSEHRRSPSKFYGKTLKDSKYHVNKTPQTCDFNNKFGSVGFSNQMTPSKVYDVKKSNKNKKLLRSSEKILKKTIVQQANIDSKAPNSDELKNFQPISRILKKGNKKKRQKNEKDPSSSAQQIVLSDENKAVKKGNRPQNRDELSTTCSSFQSSKPQFNKDTRDLERLSFDTFDGIDKTKNHTARKNKCENKKSPDLKLPEQLREEAGVKDSCNYTKTSKIDMKNEENTHDNQAFKKVNEKKEVFNNQKYSKPLKKYDDKGKDSDFPDKNGLASSKNRNLNIKSPSQKIVYKPTPLFKKNSDYSVSNPKPNRFFLSRNKPVSPLITDPSKDPYTFEAEDKPKKPSDGFKTLNSFDKLKNDVFPSDISKVTNVYGKTKRDKSYLSKKSSEKMSGALSNNGDDQKQPCKSSSSWNSKNFDLLSAQDKNTSAWEPNKSIEFHGEKSKDSAGCFTFDDHELPIAFQSNKTSKTFPSEACDLSDVNTENNTKKHPKDKKSTNCVKKNSKTKKAAWEFEDQTQMLKSRKENDETYMPTEHNERKNTKSKFINPVVLLSPVSEKMISKMSLTSRCAKYNAEVSPAYSNLSSLEISQDTYSKQRQTNNKQSNKVEKPAKYVKNSETNSTPSPKSCGRAKIAKKSKLKNDQNRHIGRSSKLKNNHIEYVNRDGESESPNSSEIRSNHDHETLNESKESTPQDKIIFNFKKICEDIIAESDSCAILTLDGSSPHHKRQKKLVDDTENPVSFRSDVSWIQNKDSKKEHPLSLYSKFSNKVHKGVSHSPNCSVNEIVNMDECDLQNFTFNFGEEKSIRDDDDFKLSQTSKIEDTHAARLSLDKEPNMRLSSSTPFSTKGANVFPNGKFTASPDISKIEIDEDAEDDVDEDAEDDIDEDVEDNVDSENDSTNNSPNISFATRCKNVFKSGPSSGRFRKGRKRKSEEMSDKEEPDDCTQVSIENSPIKLQPRKLFKENCNKTNVKGTESPQRQIPVSEQNDEAMALTDLDMNVPVDRGVTALIRSFGLDLHNQMKVKHGQLETLMEGTIHRTEDHIQECFSSDVCIRRKLNADLKSNIVHELSEVEKDIKILQKCEEDSMNFFKQQIESFRLYGTSQGKRLCNFQSMHDGFFKETTKADKKSANNQRNLKETMREEMVQLQKKLMKAKQKREIMNVKRSLQTLIC